jgi:hypothetical protein
VLLNGGLKISEEGGLLHQRLRAFINIAANRQQIHPSKAFETAKAGMEIAQRFGLGSELAILLGNAIEAAQHLGAWEWIRSRIAEIGDSVGDFGLVVMSIRSIHEAMCGNVELAESYRNEFIEFVGDSSSTQDQAEIAASKGAIAFVTGAYGVAVEAAAEEDTATATHILELLGVSKSAALWAGDIEAAKARKSWLEESVLQNEWKSCRIKTLDAGIAALEGDRERATELFREALAKWDELQIPLGKALAQMDFLFTVGVPAAADEAREAEAFFAEAGNDLFVRKIRDALAV